MKRNRTRTKAVTKRTRFYYEQKCAALERIIHGIWWMARRYANGRCSTAPWGFNHDMDELLKLGMTFHPDIAANPPSIYADDGQFGKWNGGRFEGK